MYPYNYCFDDNTLRNGNWEDKRSVLSAYPFIQFTHSEENTEKAIKDYTGADFKVQSSCTDFMLI